MNLDQVMFITFNLFCTCLFYLQLPVAYTRFIEYLHVMYSKNHRFYLPSHKVFIQLMEGGTPLFKYTLSLLFEKFELENIKNKS